MKIVRPAGEPADPLEHLLLTAGRVDRRFAVPLDLADLDHHRGALVQQPHNLLVELIDADAQRVKVGLGLRFRHAGTL